MRDFSSNAPVFPRFSRLTLGLGALALVASSLLAACGKEPPPKPEAFLGTYDVQIERDGLVDDNIMTVTLGSKDNVLLNFEFGVSQVRCKVHGDTDLLLPRQTLHVSHSTGVADGVATGMGALDMDGNFDLTIDLISFAPGISLDAGFDTDGGLPSVPYHITGTRRAQ